MEPPLKSPHPRPPAHRTAPAARALLAGPVLLAALALTGVPLPLTGRQEPDLFSALEARHIGPAGMSGRVSDVEVVLSDRDIVYVGSATGGVFKSVDGGITWNPVFDGQNALSIGAVAVFQPNPDVVWVGTGEGNPRNSAGVGRGLYRSLDGGETWESLGLENSERIHRIVTHPVDPDIAYVAAMGPAWSDGRERGLYRTRDGGRTWDNVLRRGERTGVGDAVMDPSNPDRLLVTLWEFRREPWFLDSGGPGSGVFLTADGGDSWRELTAADGMPEGDLGRSGVAFSASDPEVAYALVEAEKSALLRSDDGGASWRTVSDAPGINPRPFYYADIRIDPKNENRIYRLASTVDVSEDGGRSWRTVVPSAIVHGDIHELWIDPDDSERMILGEDGGIAFTYDRGDNWRFVENLPLAQFYRIETDDAVPFNVYGGLQDNGSWYGPSTVWENKGVLNAHWRRVGSGDGFTVMPDRSDPDRYGYSMSQGGNLQHFDKLTGARRSIRPVHPDGIDLRFNWNAGLAWDPHDPETIYLGSQFLHRSRDRGRTWEIISPDLTTDDPLKQRAWESGGLTTDASGAEMHTTILSVAVSPLEPGVIWVGTDDGNVQLTVDGGASWTNVAPAVPGLPAGIWIPDVQPSRHFPGRAYLVAEDHRRGDWTTYLYATEDYGVTWSPLAGADVDGFAHAIEEDPVEENLLFLGTEFGLEASLDRGSSWEPFRAGVPAVPVRDLRVHPRDGDLVLGTHGRAAIVIDDVRPLRELAAAPEIVGGGIHVFKPPPARRVRVAEAIGYRSTGHAMQQGETRPVGALISFWTPEEGEAVIEIADTSGALVYSTSVETGAGVNREVWNLRPGGDADETVFPSQLAVLPGSYAVRALAGGEVSEATLEVVADPRTGVGPAELIAQRAALNEANAAVREVDEARERLTAVVEGVETVLNTLPQDSVGLVEMGEELLGDLRDTVRRLFTGPECQGLCGRRTVARLVGAPVGRITGEEGSPSANTRVMMRQARAAADEIVETVETIMEGPVAAYRERLRAAGYVPFHESEV